MVTQAAVLVVTEAVLLAHLVKVHHVLTLLTQIEAAVVLVVHLLVVTVVKVS